MFIIFQGLVTEGILRYEDSECDGRKIIFFYTS
jgi:hypothetical protein